MLKGRSCGLKETWMLFFIVREENGVSFSSFFFSLFCIATFKTQKETTSQIREKEKGEREEGPQQCRLLTCAALCGLHP